VEIWDKDLYRDIDKWGRRRFADLAEENGKYK
jgi:hypothetical protein